MRTVKLLFTMSFQASVSTPLKSGSMRYTVSERRLKKYADQLLPGSFVERTETAFGLRGKIKQSTTYPDAHITDDYAPINVKPAGGRQSIGRDFDRSLWPGGRAFEFSCCPWGRDI